MQTCCVNCQFYLLVLVVTTFVSIFPFLRAAVRAVSLVRPVFSERELVFMFAICRRPSVRLSSVCLSVTFVHPTQPIEIFGNVSAPFNTLVT